MSKVKIINTEPRSVSHFCSIWQVVVLGLGLGILYWAISTIIEFFAIKYLFCDFSTLVKCQNITNVSGNIAIILTAVAGVAVMVRLRMVQPLMVSIASAIALCGVSSWTQGLVWYETLFFDVVLYLLAYVLFSWIFYYKKLIISIVITVFIIALIYVIDTL